MSRPIYTVRRYRVKAQVCYGPLHYSENCHTALCGQVIDEYWWIVTNDRDGEATCKRCLKIAKGRQ